MGSGFYDKGFWKGFGHKPPYKPKRRKLTPVEREKQLRPWWFIAGFILREVVEVLVLITFD